MGQLTGHSLTPDAFLGAFQEPYLFIILTNEETEAPKALQEHSLFIIQKLQSYK